MFDVFNCAQGSLEWHEARLGIPTASMFGVVMAKGRNKQESRTRKKYLYKLVGEILTGQPMFEYTNSHMERGKLMEGDARNAYEFQTENRCNQVGFIRNGMCGASPDSLIGSDGALEIKTKLPHLQIEVLMTGNMPPEHLPQVQGQIMVSEREWCDFCSYWPGLPLFIKRIYRDDKYISEMRSDILQFVEEMDEVKSKLDNFVI